MSRFIQTVSPMKGGTKMTYGGCNYHFTPNELGDYVAEVANEQHYDAILSIGAGYKPYPNASVNAAARSVQARVDADSVSRGIEATEAGGGGNTPTYLPKTGAGGDADRMAALRAAKAAKKATA